MAIRILIRVALTEMLGLRLQFGKKRLVVDFVVAAVGFNVEKSVSFKPKMTSICLNCIHVLAVAAMISILQYLSLS